MTLIYRTPCAPPELLFAIIQETLDYCRNVAEARSEFRITQKEVLVEYI